MNEHKGIIPSFKHPPISEVAMSAQFDTLRSFNIQHIGMLWERYKTELPAVETHSPINPVIERFGINISSAYQEPAFEVLNEAPFPRTWFLAENRKELLQVQPDRFIRNWRKMNGDDKYPRYDKYTKPKFRKDLQKFIAFAAENSLGEIAFNQCELSYINIITPCAVWKGHDDISKVFTLWNSSYKRNSILETESIRMSVSQIIQVDSKPIGRLHINVEPLFMKEDKKPIFKLSLIARGTPIGTGIAGILKFADLGREVIVRTFDKITTDKMHREWGKES